MAESHRWDYLDQLPTVRRMQLAGSFLLGLAVTPIITGSRVNVAMAHHLLHRADILARVEQVTGEGAAQVMQGKALASSRGGAVSENVVNRLIDQALAFHVVTAADRVEQRAGIIAVLR